MNHRAPRPHGWLSRRHKQGRPWWRRIRLEYLRRRAVLHRDPTTRFLYRAFIGGFGTLIVLVGLVMVPFPGPGWLVVFIGVAVIASEFEWARRILHRGRDLLAAWTRWLRRQHWWVNALLGLCTAAFVAGVVYLTLRITGLPAWVPFQNHLPAWTGLR